MNLPFLFVTDRHSYDTGKVFYAHLPRELHGSESLLEALYHLLWFPGYFGFNWNALYDCLRDFSWISCHLIVLAHEDLPAMSEGDLRIYLEVLRDAVLDWKPGESHRLEVIFHERDRVEVERLLA